MVSGNDPVESFFNSVQAVKDVLSPLELGVRRAAKDLEHRWWSKNEVNDAELFAELSGVGGVGDRNGKVQSCRVKKKNGQCVVTEERKKGLWIRIPIKNFWGMFLPNSANGYKDEVSRKGLTERDLGKEDDASCMNCLQFAVTWSLLVNNFVQSFPSHFKPAKKRFQKMGDEDGTCLKSGLHPSKLKDSCELRKQGLNDQFSAKTGNEGITHKEGKHMQLECLLGFVFHQLSQNFLKFDQGVEETEQKGCDSSTPVSPKFDHLKAITSILEGRKADVNGFLGNLSFARVGGVASIVGITSSVKEPGTDGDATGNREEASGSSPQKLANGLLNIPLSNVERLRSTLSTVSLTELIELVPQLGRPSKDYPDKKKLFSVQDFFRYTESEGMW